MQLTYNLISVENLFQILNDALDCLTDAAKQLYVLYCNSGHLQLGLGWRFWLLI